MATCIDTVYSMCYFWENACLCKKQTFLWSFSQFDGQLQDISLCLSLAISKASSRSVLHTGCNASPLISVAHFQINMLQFSLCQNIPGYLLTDLNKSYFFYLSTSTLAWKLFILLIRINSIICKTLIWCWNKGSLNQWMGSQHQETYNKVYWGSVFVYWLPFTPNTQITMYIRPHEYLLVAVLGHIHLALVPKMDSFS